MGKKTGSPSDGETKGADMRPDDAPAHSEEQPDKLTVDQWRDKHFPERRGGLPHPDLQKHVMASAHHGWPQHEHHMQRPMELTEDDYLAAIAAAQRQLPECLAKKLPRWHEPARFQLNPKAE